MGFVENQLHAEMQVRGFKIIGVFGGAVAGPAEISDDIARLYHRPDLEGFIIGEIFAEMGVIIVAFFIKAADSDPPAAVLIPAQRLDRAALHRDDRGADRAHHVVAQVLALKSIGPAVAEIVALAVGVAFGDRGESL